MKIKLLLNSTWWDKPPKSKVIFDDQVLWNGEVLGKTTHEFKVNVDNKESSTLCLKFYGKEIDQTVADGSEILKDQLLHIENIIIDDIELDYLIYSGLYYPEYPEHMILDSEKNNTPLPKILEKSINLGWNGEWKFKFNHPFYIWYCENLP